MQHTNKQARKSFCKSIFFLKFLLHFAMLGGALLPEQITTVSIVKITNLITRNRMLLDFGNQF